MGKADYPAEAAQWQEGGPAVVSSPPISVGRFVPSTQAGNPLAEIAPPPPGGDGDYGRTWAFGAPVLRDWPPGPKVARRGPGVNLPADERRILDAIIAQGEPLPEDVLGVGDWPPDLLPSVWWEALQARSVDPAFLATRLAARERSRAGNQKPWNDWDWWAKNLLSAVGSIYPAAQPITSSAAALIDFARSPDAISDPDAWLSLAREVGVPAGRALGFDAAPWLDLAETGLRFGEAVEARDWPTVVNLLEPQIGDFLAPVLPRPKKAPKKKKKKAAGKAPPEWMWV